MSNSPASASPSNIKDRVLADWKAAADRLEYFKSEEARLRDEVVNLFSAVTAEDATGTENVDVGWGHTMKIVRKLNYSFAAAVADAPLDAVLDKIEATTEGGKLIAERLVKYKPELSLTEYKLLNDANKALINSVLTVRPAKPSVELIAPKVKPAFAG